MNKNTNLCISIASSPGDFGAQFHNQAYKDLQMNWVYLPRKVTTTSQLKSVISGVRSLNIKGCSVSMPFKERVIEFIDELDSSAETTGAVNTILNSDGTLKGFNTDLFGAKEAISKLDLMKKGVLIVGAGGVAKAVIKAVSELGGDITITNRTDKSSKDLASQMNIEFIPWDQLNSSSGYMLINATSVGMNNKNEMIVSEKTLDGFEVIMDVVIYPRLTKLIRVSSENGKKIINGIEMCVYQAAKQFKIYTGKEVPQSLIASILEEG
jgi:shikimate dehydrogenase